MNGSQVMVTVCMLVYNHEKYLRKAIDSILMQQTNYPFEIFIHDDASSDGSAAMIQEYKRKYPDKIRAVIQKENLYMKHRARFNRVIFSNMTGKYVAACEGDDYWTDPFKIQKQVEYLEKHTEYVAVAQQVEIIDEEGRPYVAGISGPKFHKQHFEIRTDHDFSLKELQQGRMMGQVASCMYRNIWREMQPDFFDTLCHMETNGDRIITTALFFHGKIRCKKEIVSAYRRSYNNGSYNARVNGKNMCLSFIRQAREFQVIAEYFQKEIDFSEIYAKAVAAAVKCLYAEPTKENWRLLAEAWRQQPKKCITVKLLAGQAIEKYMHAASLYKNREDRSMKICERGMAWIQIVDEDGNARACSWAKNAYLGNLIEDDMESILNGRRARKFQKALADGSYSNCRKDNCPYLANGTMDQHLAECRHEKYPRALWLAYEGNCNYRCTCCTSYKHMKKKKNVDYEKQYALIEEKLKPILPYVKEISANGRGELFASPHILKILSEWKPVSPPQECSVVLETNGSLFDEKHWKQIENLGQYHLSVAVTVMSFDEGTYQFLSGCKYPISKLENSLRFVSGLRRKGIINYLEIATVLQEYNFREMPQFVRRCIDEFGADNVRIRPIVPGGPYSEAERWFMDVRNPKHPYYSEYRRIMEDKIFKHPKVLLWAGDLASGNGDFPWRESKLKDVFRKGIKYLKLGKK